MEALARDTHKFESRYLDRLVGLWPEDEELYRARSPIHHTDRLACPVIFFQGLDDKVVPPNHAKTMVDALLHKICRWPMLRLKAKVMASNCRRTLSGPYNRRAYVPLTYGIDE